MNAPAESAFGDTFVPPQWEGQTIIGAARNGVPLSVFAAEAHRVGAYEPTPHVEVFSLTLPVSEEQPLADVLVPQAPVTRAVPAHHRPALYAGLGLFGVAVYLMCRKQSGSFKLQRTVYKA